jgi:ABC-type transport system involved in cytochrome bd biosynthesis fused ATPase/permease subunit
MGTQAGLAALVKYLIDSLLTSNIGFIAVPFLTIFLLLRFILWVRATSKGENMADMRAEFEDSMAQTQTVMSNGYAELRSQGFSTREIAHLRRQRAGGNLPSRESQQRMIRRRLK